jgi:hypothetical protein
MCFGMEGGSCSTSGTCRVALATNSVSRDECGNNRVVITTSVVNHSCLLFLNSAHAQDGFT